MTAVLVTTAVTQERDAVADALGRTATVELGRFRGVRALCPVGIVDVVAIGAGPVAAAAGAAHCLGQRSYDIVICAGSAGRYPGAGPDRLVVADRVVLDGFGAGSPHGHIDAAILGLGRSEFDVDNDLAVELSRRCGAPLGMVVTVLAATGTESVARERAARWGAQAEAMEGAGVAAAAVLTGCRFGEVRAISNEAGVRDRERWDLQGSGARLGVALAAALGEPLP